MATKKTPNTNKKALGGLNFNTKVSTEVRTDLGGTNVGEVSKIYKKQTPSVSPAAVTIETPAATPVTVTPVKAVASEQKSTESTPKKVPSKASVAKPELPECLRGVTPSLSLHVDLDLYLDIQAVLLAPKYKRKKNSAIAQLLKDWVEKNKKEIPAERFANYREDAIDEYSIRISTKRAKTGA